MQFFKNPEYNALKMVFMLFFFILVGVFALGNLSDRDGGNVATVLPSSTQKKDRPWRDFASLKADGKLNGLELAEFLEVTVAYDTANLNTVSLDSLVVKKGFSAQPKTAPTGLRVQTVDSSGKVITSRAIKAEKTEVHVLPPQGGTATNIAPIVSSKGKAVVLIPFVPSATTVRVVNAQNTVVVSKTLTGVSHLNNVPTFKALDGKEFQNRTRMPETKNIQSFLFGKKAQAAGDPTKYEFVFIGNGYSSGQLTQFHADVTNFTNQILSIQPLKSRASQISFAYVDNTTSLNCVHQAYPTDGRLVTCDNALATQLVNSAGAPYDKIVIIHNEPNFYAGSGGAIPVAYNGTDGPVMIIHEAVGHSLGQLADVYPYGTTGVIDSTVHNNNCYAGNPPASAWSDLVGSADYTSICQNSNWYDAGTSMMENLGVLYFTAPEQKSINAQLDIYAGPFADSSNPTVSITSPANNTVITTEDFVTVSATASDNLGISRVAFYLDGALIKNTYVAPYSFSFLNFPSGTHSIEVRAYDAQNNTTTSTISVTRSASSGDTTAPTAPTNLISSNVTATSATLTWGVSSDNIAVSAYDVYKGGVLLASTQQNTYGVSSLTANTAYSFYVKARDAAGNVSPASNTVNLTTQPISNGTTVVTSPTQGQVIAPGVVTPINVTAPSNATSVRFYQQFNAFSTFEIGADTTLPFGTTWTPQGVGTYTFTANSYSGTTLIGSSAPVVVTVVQ